MVYKYIFTFREIIELDLNEENRVTFIFKIQGVFKLFILLVHTCKRLKTQNLGFNYKN